MNRLYVPVGPKGELLQRSDLGAITHKNHPFSRPKSNDQKQISIWDVDGTITSDWINETTGLVWEWMVRQHYIAKGSKDIQQVDRFKQVLLDQPNDSTRRAYYTELNIAADKHMKQVLPEKLEAIAYSALEDAPIHTEILPHIERMQQENIPIFLASGTPSALLPRIAEKVGAHFIIGTHFPQKNGRYDLQQETISRGRGKEVYLHEWLGKLSLATLNPNDIERLGQGQPLSYSTLPEQAMIHVAFGAGNTAHDEAILNLAANKLVVDGDKALLEYAEKTGAETLITANSARVRLQDVPV